MHLLVQIININTRSKFIFCSTLVKFTVTLPICMIRMRPEKTKLNKRFSNIMHIQHELYSGSGNSKL